MTNQDLDPAQAEEARRLVEDIRQGIERECNTHEEKIATFHYLTIEFGGPFPIISQGIKESAQAFNNAYHEGLRKQREGLIFAFKPPFNVYDRKGYQGLYRN